MLINISFLVPSHESVKEVTSRGIGTKPCLRTQLSVLVSCLHHYFFNYKLSFKILLFFILKTRWGEDSKDRIYFFFLLSVALSAKFFFYKKVIFINLVFLLYMCCSTKFVLIESLVWLNPSYTETTQERAYGRRPKRVRSSLRARLLDCPDFS